MSAVPILQTERLILREHRPDDLDAYLDLWTQDDVVRFISGRPLTRSECWGRILRSRGLWAVLGAGFWTLTDRESGKLIGEAGLMDIKRAIEPPLDGTLEAGWALHPSVQGKGLAREAMTAILDWADHNYRGVPLSCIISEGNKPSVQLATHLGFQETARGALQDSTVIHFRRAVGA
ncbi:GNAT family N-acetyltransferase [Neoaquamicrobium sediminum]|uniref:GNAT family N-acetyltransferase n=1 Tax=Neoaquamicrobium sediminum TaxID=1849104 RepID=UPI003BABF932